VIGISWIITGKKFGKTVKDSLEANKQIPLTPENSVKHLDRSIGISLMSSYFSHFLGLTLNYIVKLILARILIPADFGLFAIASLVVTIAEIINDLGISKHLIRSETKFYGNGLMINVAMSAFLVLLIKIFSPCFSFFNPEIPNVVSVFSIALIPKAFSAIPVAYLTKELRLKKLIFPEFIKSLSFGVLSVALALKNFGVYSFIYAQIICSVIYAVMVWLSVHQDLKLEFTLKYSRQLISFGKYFMMLGLLGPLINYGDNGILGAFLSSAKVGLYFMAFSIITLPTSIIEPSFQRVLFPVFAKLADNKPELQKVYKDSTLTIISLENLIYIILFIYADLFVKVILGPNWVEAIPYVRIMCFMEIMNPIAILGSTLLQSLKRESWVFLTWIANLVIKFSLGIILVKSLEIYGMIAANYIGYLLSFVFALLALMRLIRIKVFFKEYFLIYLPLACWLSLLLPLNLKAIIDPIITIFLLIYYIILLKRFCPPYILSLIKRRR